MRIILLLATAVGAAGIGGAALAQSGAGFARQGAGSHGTAPPMARHDGLRGDRYFRPCLSEGFDRRRCRRTGRFERYGGYYPGRYGFAGIDGPYEAVDPYGGGFFAGGRGAVRLREGRPYYDYDRSYPYEWASAAAGGGTRWEVEESPLPPPASCTFENGVRVCRGGPAPVR